MPENNNNGGLSLEALLAAARAVESEAAEEQPVSAPSAEAAAEPAAARQAAPAAASTGQSGASNAAAGAAAAGVSAARAQSAPAAETEAAEPAAEPSALVQEEALEQAEAREAEREAAPVFDLAAALGYGSREAEPASVAEEPEEKFDLAAALGYKSQEVREREAAEAAAAEARAQAQAVQDQAYREAEQRARKEADIRGDHDTQPTRAERTERSERIDRAAQAEPAAQPSADERTVASKHDSDRPQVRSRSFEATKKTAVSPEERYAAKGTSAQTTIASDGSTIESYQPTKRDRSAQARAARPLKKAEVSEVAQAIAAEAARTEYVETAVEEKVETAASKQPSESKAPEVAASDQPSETKVGEVEEAKAVVVEEKAPAVAESRPTEKSSEHAAPVGEPVVSAKEQPAPPQTEPVIVADVATVSQPAATRTKPVEPAPAPTGQPLPVISPATPSKPATMPHKVPVRTTEEIIKPAQAPAARLGVISPEAARHEATAKKKVQSAERKIVKKVRRFRTLGMFLIVLALAALAGAIFLFVAGNAQANESIEAEATRICEQAGRTITYRYKAADSNGTLCPTTEVATFSAGDVLEQSVITMNTPDFETAGHTLANFKRQFEKSSYVDGRVDGSTVIFTLHMSNERVMKVTYTALLMKNTTGCEVIL